MMMMMMAAETEVHSENLSHQKSTWHDWGSNRDRWGGKPVANRLS
jgi:hypothetical protein